jgi:oxygen-independent coproporphyrinogen-3 oxidase
VLSGQSPVAESELLTAEQRARERLVFGLRRLEGVDGPAFAEATGFTIDQLVGEALVDYLHQGWLAWEGDRLQLTEAGLLFSDSIWPDFI